MSFSRYVALGDSTTEGLDDPYPGTADEPRGWADRLAEQLAVFEPELLYANLAIRGRKVAQIRAEQLEPALAMGPDLASVVGGLNDILRPSVDVDAVAGDLEAMVSALRGSGAEVLMMSYPDPTAVISVAGAQIESDEDVPGPVMARARESYEMRIARRRQEAGGDADSEAESAEIYREVRRRLLQAERERLVALRQERSLPGGALRELELDLDVEESRLR